MVICPNCGNDAGDSKFCPNCGTKIEEEMPKSFCPNCGSDVGDSAFCPNCGTKMGENDAEFAHADGPGALHVLVAPHGQDRGAGQADETADTGDANGDQQID